MYETIVKASSISDSRVFIDENGVRRRLSNIRLLLQRRRLGRSLSRRWGKLRPRNYRRLIFSVSLSLASVLLLGRRTGPIQFWERRDRRSTTKLLQCVTARLFFSLKWGFLNTEIFISLTGFSFFRGLCLLAFFYCDAWFFERQGSRIIMFCCKYNAEN